LVEALTKELEVVPESFAHRIQLERGDKESVFTAAGKGLTLTK